MVSFQLVGLIVALAGYGSALQCYSGTCNGSKSDCLSSLQSVIICPVETTTCNFLNFCVKIPTGIRCQRTHNCSNLGPKPSDLSPSGCKAVGEGSSQSTSYMCYCEDNLCNYEDGEKYTPEPGTATKTSLWSDSGSGQSYKLEYTTRPSGIKSGSSSLPSGQTGNLVRIVVWSLLAILALRV